MMGNPIFLGILIPTLLAMLTWIGKRLGKLLSHVIEGISKIDDLHNGQDGFRLVISELMANQEELKFNLNKHIVDEGSITKDILNAINDIGNQLDEKSLATATIAFKQSAFHSPVAYFITGKSDDHEDGWEFKWGNETYFDLSGLTLDEAKAEIFWEKNVRSEDRENMKRTAYSVMSRGDELNMEYVHVIPDKGAVPVHMSVIPIKDRSGNPIAYFGAINKLGAKEHETWTTE